MSISEQTTIKQIITKVLNLPQGSLKKISIVNAIRKMKYVVDYTLIVTSNRLSIISYDTHLQHQHGQTRMIMIIALIKIMNPNQQENSPKQQHSRLPNSQYYLLIYEQRQNRYPIKKFKKTIQQFAADFEELSTIFQIINLFI
ncbi:hypothetical protein pb186bvf_001225 [Paramecium bursaria]